MTTPEEPSPGTGEASWVSAGGRLPRLLRAVSRALASGGGADAVLAACCQALVDHVDAAFARLWTLAPGEDTLRLQASAGRYTRVNGTYARVRVGDLKIGEIAARRRAHMTNDVPHDPRILDHDWALREGMVAFAGLPLVADDVVVGVMALFASHALQPEVLSELESVAATLAQFVGREQAASVERHRLAQELHDTVSQGLYGISLAAESAMREANSEPGSRLDNQLQDILKLTSGAQAELRALILGIRPDSIDRDGLVAALVHLVNAFSSRHRVSIESRLDVEPQVSGGAKLALYRIAQEALSNAGRHARASGVTVALVPVGAGYELSVEDDGRGFVPDDKPGHVGLRTMRERAREHGWELQLTAPPGGGSRVTVAFEAQTPERGGTAGEGP